MTLNNSVIELERVLRDWSVHFENGYAVHPINDVLRFQIFGLGLTQQTAMNERADWIDRYTDNNPKVTKKSYGTWDFEDQDTLDRFLTFYNLRWQM